MLMKELMLYGLLCLDVDVDFDIKLTHTHIQNRVSAQLNLIQMHKWHFNMAGMVTKWIQEKIDISDLRDNFQGA